MFSNNIRIAPLAMRLRWRLSAVAVRSRSRSGAFTWLVTGLLYLTLPRTAQAESALQAKYEYYREADDRITVQAQYLAAEVDIGTSTHFAAEGVVVVGPHFLAQML